VQVFLSAAAGPVILILVLFIMNLARTPPELERYERALAGRLRELLDRLVEEKRVLEAELTPAVSLACDNSPEFGREMEVEVFQYSTGTTTRERRKTKLLKIVNLSAQSLVVNAHVVEVEPAIVEGPGPPIRLSWREGGSGNQTLPAHGFDYVVLSPPIPDVELWERPHSRTVQVSVWVSGQLGATARYRLDNLRTPGQFPWVTQIEPAE